MSSRGEVRRGAMQRCGFALAALLATLLLPGVAAAEADVHRSRVSGPTAYSFWTTFPADGVRVPGAVYTSTHVLTADWVVQEVLTAADWADRYTRTFLDFDEFTFTFDALGRLIPLSVTNGRSMSGSVTLAVDRELRSASAEATVRLTTCSFFPRFSPFLTPRHALICGSANNPVSAGTAPVRVTWTAQGELREHGVHEIDVSPCLTDREHIRGVDRVASASGSFADRDLGASQVAWIVDSSSSSLRVEHLPHSPRPPCPPPG